MQLKAGARLKSTVCDAEVVVVRAPAGDVELTCGGQPMVVLGEEFEPGKAPEPGKDEGILLGKRYTDAEGTIEVLCTKAGTGSLWLDGQPLKVKEAKPLPSSD